MKILGINMSCLDTSASILEDGKIKFAVREERLTRKKRTRDFPINSVKLCLEYAGIDFSDLDAIAVSWNPAINLERLNMAHSQVARYKPEHFYSVPNMLFSLTEDKPSAFSKQEFYFQGGKKLAINYINHHLAHAAEAYYLSDFKDAAILTMDAYGEKTSIGLWKGKGNNIELLKDISFPNSIGSFYGAFTQFLGFTPDADEWKMMGAAAYGDPDRYYKRIRKLIQFVPDRIMETDLSYFHYHLFSRPTLYSEKLIELLGAPRREGEALTKRHFDIAAAVQKVTEEAIFYLLRQLYGLARSKNICISGGVGLNCAVNGKILKDTRFKKIFISSSPDDGGTSVGASLALYYNMLGKKRRFIPVGNYWGPGYSDTQIAGELKKFNLRFEKSGAVEKTAAKLLAEGKIIGWFQGRMEFGERALGNRSILCDPRDSGMKDKVNKAVKYREAFRPFAPAILEEYAKDYFVNPVFTPYMEKALLIKPGKRNAIPAVTHADGTGRLQTVSKKINPLFWSLINEFRKITGVPVVLNTSFNLNLEPIVCKPSEAIRTFFSSGLDALIIGSYVIKK